MAGVLEQQQAAVLLEQCRKDVQNAYGYLVQISANIVYPATASDTAGILKQKGV
jgi:hypothetical protein